MTLRFRCPTTSREVDSGVSTRSGACLVSLRVRCPVCEGLHEYQFANGGLILSAHHRSNGRQLTEVKTAIEDSRGLSAEVIELREQLLDELNHRLKNNLQILHGLLQHAARKTKNSEAREVLADTVRRIGAMGTAQQIFYSVRNLTDVSGRGFLKAVCANAAASFSRNVVSINCQATRESLPKEAAVPLALALNELLTNAAKYGADDRGRVTIDVGLSQRSGSHELYVQDHGRGFSFDEAQRRSSGLGLVERLVRRLNGTFRVERRSGARCTVSFPDQ
jgi:two-component sensor histidine kinase